jgi:hypothetical protein
MQVGGDSLLKSGDFVIADGFGVGFEIKKLLELRRKLLFSLWLPPSFEFLVLTSGLVAFSGFSQEEVISAENMETLCVQKLAELTRESACYTKSKAPVCFIKDCGGCERYYKCRRLNVLKNKREAILGNKFSLIADGRLPVASEWDAGLSPNQRRFIGLAAGVKATSASYAKAYGISVDSARRELRHLAELGWVSISSSRRRYVYTKIK